MNSVAATCSPAFLDQPYHVRDGAPSKRKLLLAKSIEALSAPSLPNGSMRALRNCHFNEMVAVRAYYKAEGRRFQPGFELEDWLEAERELLGVPAYFFD